MNESPYLCNPNILDSPDYVAKIITLAETETDCVKAGSPISADGKISNDEHAIGILLYDCHICNGNHRAQVVITGRINEDVARSNSGITISDAAKSALVNISFTGDGARMGGGGSGAAVFVATYGETTFAEVLEAYNAGKVCFARRDECIYPLYKADLNVAEPVFYFWQVYHTGLVGVDLKATGWTNRATDFQLELSGTASQFVGFTSDGTAVPKALPKGAAVADAAGSAPTAEEFNALLASLRAAGYLAT